MTTLTWIVITILSTFGGIIVGFALGEKACDRERKYLDRF